MPRITKAELIEHVDDLAEKCAQLMEERKPSERVVAAVKRLTEYALDLDLTERPAIGEYDVTADIRLVCGALVPGADG